MMVKNVQVTRLRPRQPIQSEHQETWDVQALARKFVTDPIYLTNLRNRLRTGEAGAMESTIWKYAFGQPNESLPLDLNLESFNDEELDQFEAFIIRATKSGSTPR